MPNPDFLQLALETTREMTGMVVGAGAVKGTVFCFWFNRSTRLLI